MKEPKKANWFVRLAVAFAVLVVVCFALFVANIYWNVEVYGSAAREMAAALNTRYPKLTFEGSAGYEGQMHISVSELPDDRMRKEIRDWIAQEMDKRRLRNKLYLRFIEPRILIGEYDPREGKWTEV
jgi:hypothetical protein